MTFAEELRVVMPETDPENGDALLVLELDGARPHLRALMDTMRVFASARFMRVFVDKVARTAEAAFDDYFENICIGDYAVIVRLRNGAPVFAAVGERTHSSIARWRFMVGGAPRTNTVRRALHDIGIRTVLSKMPPDATLKGQYTFFNGSTVDETPDAFGDWTVTLRMQERP